MFDSKVSLVRCTNDVEVVIMCPLKSFMNKQIFKWAVSGSQ